MSLSRRTTTSHDHQEYEPKLVPAPSTQFPGAFLVGQGQQQQLERLSRLQQYPTTTSHITNINNAGEEEEAHSVAPAAEFPGSFATNYRGEHEMNLKKRNSGLRAVWCYFVDDGGWGNKEIWKSAVRVYIPLLLLLPKKTIGYWILILVITKEKFIESIGTMFQCYISALIHIVITNLQIPQVAPFVGISNIFVLSLFIYAVAPASGGHLNPMITLATMVTGLTAFSRGVLYMLGQLLGAGVAGGLIRGSLGKGMTEVYQGGGCLIEEGVISDGQAVLIETVLCFLAIFLAFGVGLDPRQAKLFGPIMGPFLVGCVIGLTSFSSIGIAPGYPGAGLNPARCFSTAVARGSFQHHWIFWIGPLAGCCLQGVTYHTAPPYHRELRKEERDPINQDS